MNQKERERQLRVRNKKLLKLKRLFEKRIEELDSFDEGSSLSRIHESWGVEWCLNRLNKVIEKEVKQSV